MYVLENLRYVQYSYVWNYAGITKLVLVKKLCFPMKYFNLFPRTCRLFHFKRCILRFLVERILVIFRVGKKRNLVKSPTISVKHLKSVKFYIGFLLRNKYDDDTICFRISYGRNITDERSAWLDTYSVFN